MALAVGLPNLTKPFILYVHSDQGLGLGLLCQRYSNALTIYCKPLKTTGLCHPRLVTLTKNLGCGHIAGLRSTETHTLPTHYYCIFPQPTGPHKPSIPYIPTTIPLIADTCLIHGEPSNHLPETENFQPSHTPPCKYFPLIQGSPTACYLSTGKASCPNQGPHPSKGKEGQHYTNSKYAYHILHSHALICQEQCFQTTEGSPIKNGKFIRKLLEVAKLPLKATIIHCKGHQKVTEAITKRNFSVCLAAWPAAIKTPSLLPIFPSIDPVYTQEGQTLLAWAGTIQGKMVLSQ
ncbi:hypothetical protein AAY473_038939 [Plecturocebus cupreus]